MRPSQLANLAIAEEKSDSKKTGGTGDDNMLDDLLKDDDDDKQLGMIPEGTIEESPTKLPTKEPKSLGVIKAKAPLILQPQKMKLIMGNKPALITSPGLPTPILSK